MKNIITREWAEKELRFYNRADVRYAIVVALPCWLIFAPCVVLVVYASLSLCEYALFLGIVLTFFNGTLISMPCWGILVALFEFLTERKMLQKGEFEIKLCTLSYKKEKPHRFRWGLVKLFYFSDFKEFEVDSSTFQCASPGDEYYIIHYRNKKTIKLLYPSAIYEYKEN